MNGLSGFVDENLLDFLRTRSFSQHTHVLAMFWGLCVEPDTVYTRIVDETFKVTQVTLSPDAKTGTRASLYVASGNNEFVVCTLEAGRCENVKLELEFTEGEQVGFRAVGAELHLTGYHPVEMVHDGGDDEDDDEEELDEEDLDDDYELGDEGASILSVYTRSLCVSCV